MKQSKTLEEMIYVLEELSYYYGLKPEEFWSSTYREAFCYCNCCMARDNDKMRESILIEDASTNKMIQSHPLNKRPKVESLTKSFKKLFDK